ncbi:hypothetical protein SLEP1_g12410 [Rubroshorea leprosula]|uniref:Uncharacterized protein n=1 Tax=Rubroshorea leprosula TaxID=152421 RepID=A0AAV5IM85_9ROSI|nr:hypothetical protein SLEP1_g12410 [Rubroshorea leprosula]
MYHVDKFCSRTKEKVEAEAEAKGARGGGEGGVGRGGKGGDQDWREDMLVSTEVGVMSKWANIMPLTGMMDK